MKQRMITVTCPQCFVCGRQSHMRVPVEQRLAHIDGAHVQDAYPDMSMQDREQLISGTHPVCWDRMFADF